MEKDKKMIKAEHMMSSMTMEKLTAYQQEYTTLLDQRDNSYTHSDRIALLEIIFTKIDTGRILIEESA
jgi:hypothetical protein